MTCTAPSRACSCLVSRQLVPQCASPWPGASLYVDNARHIRPTVAACTSLDGDHSCVHCWERLHLPRSRVLCRVPRFRPQQPRRSRSVWGSLRLDRVCPAFAGRSGRHFKKNGVDVSIKMIPQKDRHLAIASGDIQCAATTVETWVVWNANGVPRRRSFSWTILRRRRHGGAQRIARSGSEGKTVAASCPRHVALLQTRLDPEEERPVGEGREGGRPVAAAAAQAFVAGQNDAAMTYEPYLSTVLRRSRDRARSLPPRSTTRW